MNFKTRMITHEVISGLGFGLFLAVQGIFYLEKGIEVWQIGVLGGAFGIATVVFELPFGSLADIHGRIKVYRWSLYSIMAAYTMALFSTEFWHLVVSMVFTGLAVALHSGSVDAWVVERIEEQGQSDKLQSFLGAFQASMAAGMAVGAIGGGYIPALMPEVAFFEQTGWNVTFVLILTLFHLAILPFLFSEGDKIVAPDGSIKGQIKSALKLSFSSKIIRDLMLLGVTLGLAIALVDSFWQPHLTFLVGEPTYVAFGWITAGYFAMAIAGPMIISMIAEAANISTTAQVKILPIVLAGVLFVLATQVGFGGFIAAYLAFMLVFSMMGPPSETLLNTETPDEIRSTMQSVQSLSFRAGGVIAAFGFAYIINLLGIGTTWIVGAFVIAAFSVIRLLVAKI